MAGGILAVGLQHECRRRMEGPLIEEVVDSAVVSELVEGLRRGGLVGHHSLAGHPHLSAAGRAARKELESRPPPLGSAEVASATG
jgi:hypothetical protein